MAKKLKTAKDLDNAYKALIKQVTALEKAVEAEGNRVEQTGKLYTAAAEEIGRVVEIHKKRGIKATKLDDVSTLSEVRQVLTSIKPFERDIAKVIAANKSYIKDAASASDNFASLVKSCAATLNGGSLTDKDKNKVTTLHKHAELWVDRVLTRVVGKANACIATAGEVDKDFVKQADREVKKTSSEKTTRDKREIDAYIVDSRKFSKRRGQFTTAAKGITEACSSVSLAELPSKDEAEDMLKSLNAANKALVLMKRLFDELNVSWTQKASEENRQHVRDHGIGKNVDIFLASAPEKIADCEKLVAKAKKDLVSAVTAAKERAAKKAE